LSRARSRLWRVRSCCRRVGSFRESMASATIWGHSPVLSKVMLT
jgi:hypothetical protein